MTDYGTIKLPRKAYERHNAKRKEAGLTWEEYLDKESVTITHDIDRDAVADDVAKRVLRELQ